MDLSRPPLLRRLQPAHWGAVDGALTVLMVPKYVLAWRALAHLSGPHWLDATVIVIAVLPAALRRRWPRAVLALVTVGGAVAMALSTSPAPSLAVAFVMYLIPLRFPRAEALRLLGGTLLVTVAGLVAFAVVPHSRPAPGLGDVALGSLLVIAVAWLIGYSVWQHRAYSAGLREQTRRRAQVELAEARRAISEERLQIARELHDVVAHTMSLIAVQAGVANYVVGAHPQEAARALSSIEETSRGALREMRALLGMLRAEDDTALAPAPAPGLAELEKLVERTAEAGLRVDLVVNGRRRPLSTGLDLAAYRVAQEAVTNVIKHGSTDRCRVVVDYEKEALTLRVTDSGRAGERPGTEAGTAADTGKGAGTDAAPDPPVGHGITGMRERVGMYGGQFQAAPLPGRGFQVTARFPLPGGEA